MTVTVTPLLTTITPVDSATGWTGGSPSACNDFFLEGGASLSDKITTTRITYTYSSALNLDMSNGEHLYMWFNVTSADKLAVGTDSLRVQMTTGAGGAGTNVWSVFGADNYPGGWVRVVVDPASTPSFSGTKFTATELADIDQIGFSIQMGTMYSGGNDNFFWDIIDYGTGLRVTNRFGATPGTFAEIAADDLTNSYGVFRDVGGSFICRGELVLGDKTSNSHTYFSDSDEIIIYNVDIGIANTDLFGFTVQSNTAANTFITLGQAVGTGQDTVGVAGVVMKSVDTATDFKFDIADYEVNQMKLYNTTLINPKNIWLGNSSVRMNGTNTEIVDCTFSSPRLVELNSNNAVSVFLRNQSVSERDATEAAIRIHNPVDVTADQIKVVSGDGFSSNTSTSAFTYSVTDHDFSTNVQFLKIYQNDTWNIINPVWTVTPTIAELAFQSATGTTVNEEFSFDILSQDADGNALNEAAVYIFEGLTNDDLPNSTNTSSLGQGSFNITKNIYTWSGTGNPDAATRGSFFLRAYRYNYQPVRSALTVTAPLNVTQTFLTDSAVTQGTKATANGYTVTVDRAPNRELRVFDYDGGSGTLSIGSAITVNGDANGSLVETTTGSDNISGTMVVEFLATGTAITDNQAISQGGWTGSIDNVGGTDKRYTWHVDGTGAAAITNIYDFLAAKMSLPPALAPTWVDQVILWGQQENILQLCERDNTTGKYTTVRSTTSALTGYQNQGVWVSGLTGSTINQMVDDGGNAFIPPVTRTFTVSGVIAGSEVRLYTADGNLTELGTGIETTTEQLDAATVVNGGSSYAVSDVLTVSGGTFSTAAQITVNTVDGGGAITGFTVSTAGSYTGRPPNITRNAVTGGTGSDATFNLDFTDLNPFQYSYVYAGDVDTILVVFHVNYLAQRFAVTLENADATFPVQQTTDRVYS